MSQPRAVPTTLAPLPESLSYRVKTRLLGKPLRTEDLHAERLGKPVALAVLSSDVMSSCAYASESILRILIPAAGVGAFALLSPVTALLLAVLGVVCLCYRQVVATYPVSGGSYVVSRENFGFSVAQIPGAALLLSYVLTVAVSVAAGVDAVISAFPKLSPYPVELSLVCIAVLTYGNLRGIREAGRVFAVPTYWFFASMGALVVTAVVRLGVTGHLHRFALSAPGHIAVGHEGTGLLLGASAFLFLRGVANGGSAMTGMEAISNAVPVFREPTVRNARTTLVLMATILGVMFLSVSVLAALTHAVPYLSGTPTVLAEIGRVVFGSTAVGNGAFYSLQLSTACILILGANTSYNGFPLLVNFIAEDSYLPRPLRIRGHRLVYSNGIVALTVVSAVLLIVTGANVADLIPLYACTVFTGFTMAGAGMTKYHLTHKAPHRGRHLAAAAGACAASAVVTFIFVVTEFSRGAWLVVVCVPTIVFVLTRTNRRYTEERQVLAEGSTSASVDTPILRRHVVLVLVDTLDLATARAVQLARSLSLSGEVRAVHFVLDNHRAHRMARGWGELGGFRIPLELVECPDRRLSRAAREMAAELASDGETEVTFVLPRRIYPSFFNRILHGNTADRVVAAVSGIPNVSATIAPFDVADHLRRTKKAARLSRRAPASRTAPAGAAPPSGGSPAADEPDGTSSAGPGGLEGDSHVRSGPAPRRRSRHLVRATEEDDRISRMDGVTPISDIQYRRRARIAGRVRALRVQPWSGVHALECTLVDETGALNIVFLGRRHVHGIAVGSRLVVEGMVGKHDGRLAMINPGLEFLQPVAQENPAVS